MRIEYMKPARHVIDTIFQVKAGERVLIVTDTEKAEFAEPFMAAAYAVNAEPMIMIMTPRSFPGEELPEPINAAIRASDVVIGCVAKSMAANIWRNIRNFPEVTVRGASISAVTEGVMLGGGLWAEPEDVMRVVNGVHAAALDAKSWRLTTAGGTDLTAEIGRVHIIESQPIAEPRMGGVLPGCEVAIDPVLRTVNGVFYSDGSCGILGAKELGYNGTIANPIRCVVEDGRIVSIEGGKEAELFRAQLEAFGDDTVSLVSHLAVGCNPNCEMTGDYINDEKILAGIHIANAGVDGSPVGAIDHCFQRPSLWLDGIQVIDDWKFVGPMAQFQPAK